MDPKRLAKLNARYAAKMAARADGSAPIKTYPSNAGSQAPVDIRDNAYRAKTEARIAAFNKGRQPDKSGFLDVSEEPEAKAEAKPQQQPHSQHKPKDEPKGHSKS